MSYSDTRRLTGIRFSLSISAALDMPGGSDPDSLVNGLTFRLASNILLEGGTLLLGHRWIPDGIMEHLAFQALDSHWSKLKRAPSEQTKADVPILNLIAWPDGLPSADRNAQKMIREGVLEVRQILPPEIPPDRLDADPVKALTSDLGQFARIRALTAMRREMVRHTDARICLGGGVGKATRRLPGVIEEALFTCMAGKPLYLSGALGGAAKVMADALLQRRMSGEARDLFFTPPPVVGLFAAWTAKSPIAPEEGPSTEEGWNALERLQSFSPKQLGQQAGLTEEEYVQLLTSTDVQRVLGLAITGVVRLRMGIARNGPAISVT
ncbi:MAG: hypothetical protein P9F75_02820 [Candidatus Contendobacter sp.]|nr:hypothetical protein [Candidatus Contendobacter sp.]